MRTLVFVFPDALVQVVRIDGDLHDIEFAMIMVDDEQAHVLALGMAVDERLLAVFAAGFAHHQFPSGAELLLDHLLECLPVDRRIKVLELCHMQAANAIVRGSARNQADQSHERNTRGVDVVLALNGVNNAVKPTVTGGGKHNRGGNQQNDGGKAEWSRSTS